MVSIMKNIKEGKGMIGSRGASMYQLIREGLSDEVPSEQRHEGNERKSHGNIQRKRVPLVKGFEAGVCPLAFSRKGKNTSMTRGQFTRGVVENGLERNK